jgi:predicted nucleic acid-binding protein
MPTLRRAVFDTNVLISDYLWPGIPRMALDMIRSGRSMLVSAQPAIEEFVRVLGDRKFGLSLEEIAPLVKDLTSLSTIVHPRHTVDVATRMIVTIFRNRLKPEHQAEYYSYANMS